MKNTRKRKTLIILISIFSAFALTFGVCAVYVCNYYHADEGAVQAFASELNISVSTLENGAVVFEPENATIGFIFYPGGKVEHSAYQPLLAELAKSGVLCVLIEMPFRLAVLDINAADGIQAQYPNVEKWYIGGHSLGGSMAAAYLSDNHSDYTGLILLGSYSTTDLSQTELDVLSIYGSEDKVLNREKYEENKSNLSNDFSEVIIEGGNHAQFGMYCEQDGDGTPLISRNEQTNLTAEAILEFISLDN